MTSTAVRYRPGELAPSIAREVACELADALDRNNRALVEDLSRAWELADALASTNLRRVNTIQLYRARKLVRLLNHACPHTLINNLGPTRYPALIRLISPLLAAGIREDILVSDLSHVRRLARALARANDSANESGQPRARRIAPSAAALLVAAIRLLPAADRARYTEEFRSELWDLMQDGAGSARQVRYAFRQLSRAFLTSFELRFPRRRGAAP